MPKLQRNLLREYRAEFRRTSWTTEIDQTLLQCWILEEHWERTALHYTWSTMHLTRWKDHVESIPYLEVRESSRVRGRIRGNTKIGPVLDVKVCSHQGRYGVEIMIEILVIRDRTVFLGSHRERNQQIRNRNVWRNSCHKRCEQRYRETCREG